MKRTITKALSSFLLVFTLCLITSSASVKAQDAVPVNPSNSTIGDKVCQGLLSTETGQRTDSATVASCSENGNQSFSGLTRRIIDIFSIVVGSVSVIMIIIGGFRYIISGGDSSGVTAAKNTILYAIVGLVIVLFSQIIIRFIISNFRPS
jgi:hypothetical protein